VDFAPSPSQQLLVATARDFLRKHCPPEAVQRLALDERGFDEVLWRRMAELGWPGLLVPGDLGGSDGSLLDVILLVEEMGRTALPGPFVTSAVVATSLLIAARSPEQQRRLLPGLASGDRIATLALVEDDGSFDPRAVALRCEAPGRLTGAKLFVKDAHVATDLLVALGGGDVLVLPAEGDVSTAKAYAGEACLTVARRGHQIFGAIGYCEEHPLHLLHKRIQAASLDFGDAALHLETIARAIGLQ
jgi:alkylation response protein AidB-like acyl-CoA dehydrogenase